MKCDKHYIIHGPAYLALLTLILAGCGDMVVKDSPEVIAKRGELRHKLFVECMELASKNTRVGDDDVSDAIEACASVSKYMSYNMTGVSTR